MYTQRIMVLLWNNSGDWNNKWSHACTINSQACLWKKNYVTIFPKNPTDGFSRKDGWKISCLCVNSTLVTKTIMFLISGINQITGP